MCDHNMQQMQSHLASMSALQLLSALYLAVAVPQVLRRLFGPKLPPKTHLLVSCIEQHASNIAIALCDQTQQMMVDSRMSGSFSLLFLLQLDLPLPIIGPLCNLIIYIRGVMKVRA